MINVIIADTKQLTFTITDSAGEPIDMSAATVKFMVKKSMSDDDLEALILKSIINPSSNIVLIELTSDDTLLLSADDYYCALKIFFDSGVKSTVYTNTLRATKGVFDE
jgi:hypothetical protein